jgi:hypothetical protein
MRCLLLVTLIAACNPVVAHLKDAAPMEDTGSNTPDHGLVRITIYDPADTGAVVTGVPVVFVEADDTLVGHPVTDSMGVVTADVHAGASATLVITTGNTTQLETLLGLKPGDDIILGPRRGESTDAGTFTVSFPAYPGAGSYVVYGPCGSTSTTALSAVLLMQSNCKLDTMDLLVVATDASGTPLASLSKGSVTFQAGGSTAVSGTYQSMPQLTASYTNIPATVSSIDVQRSVPDDYGFSDDRSATPMNGTFSAMLRAPQGSKALITTSVTNTANSGRQTIQQLIAGNALTHGMDVAMTLLPWIGVPSFDLATHKLTVPVDPLATSGDAPDVFFANAQYTRGTDPNTQQHFDWLVIGPAPGDVTMPTLPMEVGDVMPKTTDTGSSGLAVSAESDALSGYDVIRQDVFTLITSVTVPIHPTATRTRLSINFGR